MTKITFEPAVNNDPPIGIGDWVIAKRPDGEEYLCVIAQTSGGMAQLITIDGEDANRMETPVNYNLDGGSYRNLKPSALRQLFPPKYTFRKVDVSISVKS